jgi:hypothetical protein
LTVRLVAVCHYLPLAMYQAEKDPENVHQLRVSTRRSGAAVDIFALCLPEKVYKAIRKQLRNIRRAAGAARDWDVFLDSLIGWAEHDTARLRPAYLFLMGYGLAQRIDAQGQLQALTPEYHFDLERRVAETIAAVHKPRSQPELQTLLWPAVSASWTTRRAVTCRTTTTCTRCAFAESACAMRWKSSPTVSPRRSARKSIPQWRRCRRFSALLMTVTSVGNASWKSVTS